jgi:glutamyl-Q tRNA(Asp) synthetase
LEIARAAGDPPRRDPDGAVLYPGTCRALSAEERAHRIATGAPHAMRLDMTRALERIDCDGLSWLEDSSGTPIATLAEPQLWGDVVFVRKDIPTSYHLAVVLDDAMQGITHVVRGQDLHAATSVHRLLQVILGLPAPRYHHHALVLDAEGRKLAKSAVSTPLRQFRAEGVSPAEIRRRLGR